MTRLWGKGEACALSSIALPELLIASHIKPWRDSNNVERLDPANAPLLAVHIDKLFDQHLLSFETRTGDLRTVIAPRARSEVVHRPRHFLVYRFEPTLLVVGRVLHDTMEVARHLDPGS